MGGDMTDAQKAKLASLAAGVELLTKTARQQIFDSLEQKQPLDRELKAHIDHYVYTSLCLVKRARQLLD